MSEETPAILSEYEAESQPGSKTLGAALRLAREGRGLDLEEVARQLRMSPRQVTALEANDFASLPSPTFIRGFIRNYARLLETDPEPLLAIYRDTQPESQASTKSISLHSEEIPILSGNRSAWTSYLAASVALGIAVGGWWVYMDWREKAPVEPTIAVAPPTPTPVAPLPAPAPVDLQSPVVTDPQMLPLAPEAEAQATPTGTMLPALPAASTITGSHITMKFSQQSWVRVLDRDGKEIFNKTKPENTEDFADGTPPLKVEIGNAAGVQLSYNGQSVDLTPHTKANVARLNLE